MRGHINLSNLYYILAKDDPLSPDLVNMSIFSAVFTVVNNIYFCNTFGTSVIFYLLMLCIPFCAALSTDSSNLFDIMHEARNGFVGDIIEQATC